MREREGDIFTSDPFCGYMKNLCHWASVADGLITLRVYIRPKKIIQQQEHSYSSVYAAAGTNALLEGSPLPTCFCHSFCPGFAGDQQEAKGLQGEEVREVKLQWSYLSILF